MNITVYESGECCELPFFEGETILDVLQRNRIRNVHAPCGGKGSCKKCGVYVRSEKFCGNCLACCTKAEADMVVEVTPVVRVSFADRSSANIFAPAAGQTGYAAACDIGTTTLICHLLRLDTGERIAAVSASNAQSVFGADVLSRLQAASEGRSPALTELIINQINGCICSMCRETGISVSDIKRIAVAGNTIMQHFFAGFDPAERSVAPFKPVSLFGETLNGRELGLCVDADVYICPAVSGFIGGNTTAGILASGMLEAEKPVLMADLGANSELILGCRRKYVACTADAGAVFKASLLDRGMTASAGAISGVDYRNGELVLEVLGNAKPLGICGSGMIDALGIMCRLGILDEMGRIADPDVAAPEVRRFIGEENGGRVFYLTDNHRVFVTQADINKFQLAKAAISAGIRILLEEYGIGSDDVDRVCLTGGFGTFVRLNSAGAIGLIPSELLDRARMLGNASEAGAISAALSDEAREQMGRIQSSIRFVDLPSHPSFSDAYVDGLMFE